MKYIISKIEVQKNNKERVNIYVNEEFFLACDMSLVYMKSLNKGSIIEKDTLQEVIIEDNFIKAKNRALRYLGKSYKTENEVIDKLFIIGYDDYTIKRVIEFLKQYDFVNDERYVELFIKEKSKKYGINRIKFDLQRKGVNKELISNKLQEVDKDEEFERAYEIARKKYSQLLGRNEDMMKVHKKVNDFMIRKGYDFNIIQKIIRKIEVGD